MNETKCSEESSGKAAIINRLVMRFYCWWFGCAPHPQDPAPHDFLECEKCGEICNYGDLVGDTKHNRFKCWARYWLYRKWIPEKCPDCNKRYGDHSDCIPF